MRVIMTFGRASESLYTRTRARAMCQFCLLSLAPGVGGAALGLSYVPPEIDGGWRGRIISKSGISLAGRKI